MDPCQQFRSNPRINPHTGDPIYNDLVSQCGEPSLYYQTTPIIPIPTRPIILAKPIIQIPTRPIIPIITRHIIQELTKMKRIIGPNSLSVMKLNGKLLLLFGDFHMNTRSCIIPRDGDISIIEQNSPVCTDLLIEAFMLVQGYGEKYRKLYTRQVFDDVTSGKEAPQNQTYKKYLNLSLKIL